MGRETANAALDGRTYELQDGFTEIAMGMFCALAGLWAWVGARVSPGVLLGLMLLFLVAGVAAARLLMTTRSRLIRGRLRQLPAQPGVARGERLAVLGAAALLGLGAAVLGSGGLEIWIPSLVGLGVAAPFLRIAYQTGLARLYGLSVLSMCIPVAIAMTDLDWLSGLALFLCLMGAALVLSGMSALFVYRRQNPVSQE